MIHSFVGSTGLQLFLGAPEELWCYGYEGRGLRFASYSCHWSANKNKSLLVLGLSGFGVFVFFFVVVLRCLCGDVFLFFFAPKMPDVYEKKRFEQTKRTGKQKSGWCGKEFLRDT